MEAELLQTTVMAFLRRCIELEPQPPASQPIGMRPSETGPTESHPLSTRPAGTLLLLDVDQLSLDAQMELTAFFELPVFNLRTIVTSQQRLLDLAHENHFHLPLALALSTLEIGLPALADRRQDIPFLAQQFVEDFNASGGRQLSGLTTDALDQLCALPWQGDTDELAEVIEQACQAADGPRIGLADLPKRVTLLASVAANPPPALDETIRLDDFLAEIEGELIQRALERADGNKTQAARLLGVNLARLLRKLGQKEQPVFIEQPDEEPESDAEPDAD
jgi:DNA-binding NtrC family response regulator